MIIIEKSLKKTIVNKVKIKKRKKRFYKRIYFKRKYINKYYFSDLFLIQMVEENGRRKMNLNLKNKKSYIKYRENVRILMYFNIWNKRINFY